MKNVVHRTREEVVKNWVAALRSGKYKETTETLRDSEGFCCLGVLCDLNRKDGGAPWVKNRHGHQFRYLGSFGMLSRSMMDFIRGDNIEVNFGEYAEMNDGGVSFAELADKIEKDLL